MTSKIHRRALLKALGSISVSGIAAPMGLHLASMAGAANAAGSGEDYKALVCVNFSGGNDHGNTVVPYDADHYNLYATARANLALPRDTLLPITAQSVTAQQIALPPAMAAMKALYDRGTAAIVANVGSLVGPTTLADYKAGRANLPGAIGSHSDQQSLWQTFGAEMAARPGWAGLIGDYFASRNDNPLFTAIAPSPYGEGARFLTGRNVTRVTVSPNDGMIPEMYSAKYGAWNSGTMAANMRRMLLRDSQQLMEKEQARLSQRVLNNLAVYNAAVSGVPPFSTPFSGYGASSLKTVATVIAARQQLGMKRQLFVVSAAGGFDDHSTVRTEHAGKLQATAEGIKMFHDAMIELGLEKSVTLFTVSDFGRTLDANNTGWEGSDHGWGGHHFVVGGAVKGGQVYGRFPLTMVNGPDDVYRGVLLPSTSWDQYAGTLASWFGVPSDVLKSVIPNLSAFDVQNLGFLA